jgi:isoleucyl-tRNA synthetase
MALNFPELEQKILKFWEDNKIFDKLRKKNHGKTRWSFLDGPITANNPMGVHHAWGRTYKDVFQRYKAMQGYEQRYQNGFDCQGLWVEVEVEKELGFKTKKDIETYGIDKFVEKCKERVRKYSAIQTQQSVRLGQWMDWDHSYYTMSDENNYAIWGFLKKCYEKGYLYKGKDAVPWCPRCGTAISQHEILTEEYKELTHKAIYFKLPIAGNKNFEGVSFLVWTTTPWTLPANVALAIHPDFGYGLFSNGKDKLILLKDLGPKVLDQSFKLEKIIKAKDLLGLKYEAPFDDLERVKKTPQEKLHIVVDAKDMVTAEEGTGIIHIATGAGTEDFRLGKEKGLPVIEVIGEDAVYMDGLGQFSGQNAKLKPEIILDYVQNLENGRFFYKIENYTHRYPTCWRCKAELVWRAVDEWYIRMDELRKPLMDAVKKINWIPSFGLERELDWLKNMEDWLISKKRYWGLALPIFECKSCGNFEVLGSKDELKKRAAEGWDKFEGNSPHRPWVDNVKIKCSKCGEMVSRIKDVGNPWLDAGIVSFSTISDDNREDNMPYFHNKKAEWKKWFPAEMVCESFPGQFKNWFYSIIVMSVVLEGAAPVKTIFGYASVKDEKGEEMHKSKGNAIWFDEAVEKIGADVMRWMYARANPADNLLFGYHNAKEIERKLLTLYNSFVFFQTYVKKEEFPKEIKANPKNILDKWIVSKLNSLIQSTEDNLDKYNPGAATLAIEDFFINDFSLWYLRRSRARFHEQGEEREEVIQNFYYVLSSLLLLIAPIMPFFSEDLYQQFKTDGMPESLHLNDWPKADKKKINKDLDEKMEKTRLMVNQVLAERITLGIKVRQPLPALKIKNKELVKEEELLEILKEEVNVKEIIFDENLSKDIELNTELTEDLKEEGRKREFLRTVKSLRKELNLQPGDIVSAIYSTFLPADEKGIMKEGGSKTFIKIAGGKEIQLDAKKEISIDGGKVLIGIKK